MAVAAAIPLVEAAIAEAPQILAAGQMASELATKYGPKVKGAVNHLFHMGRKKKSMASYIKKLGTQKGLKQFITRDIGKAIRGGGKAIANVGAFSNEVANMTGGMTGGVGGHANKVAQAVSGGASQAKRYHEIAESYHDSGKALVSPLKAYRF
jgi:hypothetical protein